MKHDIARTALRVLSFAMLLVGLAEAGRAQTTGCSLSTLKGTYSVQWQGTIIPQFPGFPAPPFPFAEAASDFIDSAGNITGKFTFHADRLEPFGTDVRDYT